LYGTFLQNLADIYQLSVIPNEQKDQLINSIFHRFIQVSMGEKNNSILMGKKQLVGNVNCAFLPLKP